MADRRGQRDKNSFERLALKASCEIPLPFVDCSGCDSVMRNLDCFSRAILCSRQFTPEASREDCVIVFPCVFVAERMLDRQHSYETLQLLDLKR